jgi:hypothetical protein
MNTNTVAHHRCTRISELAIQHLIAIEHEQSERIADLEDERDRYRELVQVLLDAHRKVTKDRDELRQQIDHWQKEARRPTRSARHVTATRNLPGRVVGKDVKSGTPESSWTH